MPYARVTKVQSVRLGSELIPCHASVMRKGLIRFLGLAVAAIPAAACAAETARFITAPAPVATPAPKLAAQFDLKLVVRGGRGLARQLLDAGVDQADAAAAARLAAGHLGGEATNCFAKVSLVRVSATGDLSLVRVMLTTNDDQTVIERRDGVLTIASQAAMHKSPRLI